MPLGHPQIGGGENLQTRWIHLVVEKIVLDDLLGDRVEPLAADFLARLLVGQVEKLAPR